MEVSPSESAAQADAGLNWDEEPQRLIIVDDFLPEARALRSHFDSRCGHGVLDAQHMSNSRAHLLVQSARGPSIYPCILQVQGSPGHSQQPLCLGLLVAAPSSWSTLLSQCRASLHLKALRVGTCRHVPDQYTLLRYSSLGVSPACTNTKSSGDSQGLPCRTPADHFFPDGSYSALIDALQEYGEQQLGCRGISPVWLSYYVDGCRQVLPGQGEANAF